MTVRKGEEWGIAGVAPGDLVVAGSDAELHELLNQPDRPDRLDRDESHGRLVLGVTGGDLWRTVGGRSGGQQPRPGAPCMLLPVDLGAVTVGDREILFASHLVARRSWWRGEVVAVMNAQYLGRWDVAPRSHPNDGRLDVVHVRTSMGVADRWKARRRLPSGTHVPHPDIATSRTEHVELQFERPLGLVADGVPIGGPVVAMSVRVLPDALTLAI